MFLYRLVIQITMNQTHSKECIEKNTVAYNPAEQYCICGLD